MWPGRPSVYLHGHQIAVRKFCEKRKKTTKRTSKKKQKEKRIKSKSVCGIFARCEKTSRTLCAAHFCITYYKFESYVHVIREMCARLLLLLSLLFLFAVDSLNCFLFVVLFAFILCISFKWASNTDCEWMTEPGEYMCVCACAWVRVRVCESVFLLFLAFLFFSRAPRYFPTWINI